MTTPHAQTVSTIRDALAEAGASSTRVDIDTLAETIATRVEADDQADDPGAGDSSPEPAGLDVADGTPPAV